MTSHEDDRNDRPPDGGGPTAGGAHPPGAPGAAPTPEEFLRQLEELKEQDGPEPPAQPTPDLIPGVEAPGEEAHGPGRPDSGAAAGHPEGGGPPAGEVPAYPLTRTELLVLARHWATEELDVRLFWFFYAQTSGSDSCRRAYADGRLGLIAEALGAEAVREVVADVEEEARRRMGDDDWRSFAEGTIEDWGRVQQEVCEASDYLYRKCADKEAQGRAFAFLRQHPDRVYSDEAGDLWWLSRPFPKETGRPADRLYLRVTTARGASAFAPGYELDCPPGWSAPYGLR
jgi:hypothetical protein